MNALKSAKMDYIPMVCIISFIFAIIVAEQRIEGSPKESNRGSDSIEMRAKHLVKEQKLEILITNILMRLSNYDGGRKNYLNEPEFQITQSNAECFLKTYNAFKENCAPPHLHRKVKKHRHIFAHACQAAWLDLNDIFKTVKETCEGIKFEDD